MKVDLSKGELVSLIAGSWPPGYKWIGIIQERGLGHFTGGFDHKWTWDARRLNAMTEQQLWELHLELKAASEAGEP